MCYRMAFLGVPQIVKKLFCFNIVKHVSALLGSLCSMLVMDNDLQWTALVFSDKPSIQ